MNISRSYELENIDRDTAIYRPTHHLFDQTYI